MKLSLQAQVKRAAIALDDLRPGWAYKVRLRKLDLDDPFECVLGQVFASDRDIFGCGYDAKAAEPHKAAARRDSEASGRSRWGHVFCPTNRAETAEVTYLWKNEIRTRRGRSGTSK